MSRKYDHSPKKKQTNRILKGNKEELEFRKSDFYNSLTWQERYIIYGDKSVLTENREELVKALRNLQRRLQRWERKHPGQALDVPELDIRQYPERVTKETIEEVKGLRGKKLAERELEPEEPVDIVDVELKALRDFVETFENPYVNQYSLKSAKNELLQMLDLAIESEGRLNVAMRAEEAATARDFARQAMLESNSERQQVSLNGFSRVLFGRSFTLAELYQVQRNIESYEDFEFDEE